MSTTKRALLDGLQRLEKVCNASSDPQVNFECENIHLAISVAMGAAEKCNLTRAMDSIWKAGHMAGSLSEIDYVAEAQEVMEQTEKLLETATKYVVETVNERCGCKVG